jgi:hypothetical protein
MSAVEPRWTRLPPVALATPAKLSGPYWSSEVSVGGAVVHWPVFGSQVAAICALAAPGASMASKRPAVAIPPLKTGIMNSPGIGKREQTCCHEA